jgi:hypothetical protein
VHTKGEEANAVILLWLFRLQSRLFGSFLFGLRYLNQCSFGRLIARLIYDFAGKMKKEHLVKKMPGMKKLLDIILKILKDVGVS